MDIDKFDYDPKTQTRNIAYRADDISVESQKEGTRIGKQFRFNGKRFVGKY